MVPLEGLKHVGTKRAVFSSQQSLMENLKRWTSKLACEWLIKGVINTLPTQWPQATF